MDNNFPLTREVKVEIFGKTYSLMYDGDSNHLTYVAAYLDEKMKTISSASNIIDSYKVAVLAALQIADDLLRIKKEASREEQAGSEKISALLNLIDSHISKMEKKDIKNY